MTKEWDKVIEDCNKAIRLKPGDAGAYYDRGLAYANKGEYARARADWEKVLQINPGDVGTRKNLETLRKMGN